jgi:hypothetical protein
MVGLLFGVSGVVLCGAMIWDLFRADSISLGIGAVLALGLFAPIGLYGVNLLHRGFRGWSRVIGLDRASQRFERASTEASPLRMMILGALICTWATRRTPWPDPLWYLGVSLLLLPLAGAIHEIRHLVVVLAQGRVLHALRIWPVTGFRDAHSARPCPALLMRA